MRQKNRIAPTGDGDKILESWFAVETDDGNAIAGVDGHFEWADQQSAETAVVRFATETARSVSVVGYTRKVLGTYAAVTEVKKVG